MVVINELQEKEALSSGTAFDNGYEVFLSFRGEDTRRGFTDHLYNALVEAGIDTFLDDECIETGEDLKPELENAIQKSRASVIVLSNDYASSTWCLNELVLILEQRRKFGMIVIPIFYHVDPSHVRKQEDSFAEALKKHENGIDEETDPEKKQQRIHKLNLWRDALKEVADLKGKDIKGWHETRFIQQIVTEIDHRLDRKISHTLPNLIGMLSQVRSIESWLQDGSMLDVDFTAICGMGGIGKTTLARYIYETNAGLFENSCFLGDIRNISASKIPDGKLSLQKQLLKDIKGKQDIARVDEGTRMIEKALKRKRVLLVLDDVDNVDQLDVLLGRKGFHPGSKIIITTKDLLLPKKCEVWNAKFISKKYIEHLLEGLNIDESLELLSRHAFRCDIPKVGYEEPSRKVVEYCGGHPLALKVLGSSLFQRDVAAWEDTLELLEKETDSKILKVLKISFDSLSSDNDKKLFKYIACFFVGKDTDDIGKILNGCGIYTSSGIPSLVDKCLLTLNSFYCVEMHQLLQDLGRHIVHQESLTKPWKRSILCCHKEAFNVLKEDQGTEKTQGLLLDMKILEKKKLCGSNNGEEKNFEDDQHHENSRTLALLGWFRKFIYRFWWLFGWLPLLLYSKFHPEDEENLTTESFTKMKNLELLQLNFIQLTGSYEKFPKRLRWLCWHGFPSQYIPPEFSLTKLVVLDMSQSNLKRLWKVPKSLPSLKILDLSNSLKLIRTGDFSGLPNLERLILARCGNLVEISESIGELHQLAWLDLSYCLGLRNLPRNMRKLSKTKTLRLEGCCNLFKTLVVPQSPLSSLLLFLRSVEELNLSGNNLHNESFPGDFSSLALLKKLNLSNNPIDSLPNCVRSLSMIEILQIRECENLKSALDLPSSILFLWVDGCRSLEIFTFHSVSFINVRIATLGCCMLREGQFFFELEKVRKPIADRFGWLVYEGRILSKCFGDNKVPPWFTYKTEGSSISFTVPPSPNKKRIRGLKLCFVKTVSAFDYYVSRTAIANITNGAVWHFLNSSDMFFGYEDIVLMSDWIFENNNELNVGDLVYICHYTKRYDCWNTPRGFIKTREVILGDGFNLGEEHMKNIKGCGVEIVYGDDDHNKQDTGNRSLHHCNFWEYRTFGGDVQVERSHLFQKLSETTRSDDV